MLVFLEKGNLDMNQSGPSKSGVKRKLILVICILLIFFGVFALIAGGVILFLNTGIDPEGYALSEKYQVRTTANAFVLSLGPIHDTFWRSLIGMDNIAQTKWVITNVGSKEIFAGWTTGANGTSYVESFSFEQPDREWRWRVQAYSAEMDIPSTAVKNTGVPAQLPSELSIWTEKILTNSASELNWNPHWVPYSDYYMLVVMNKDGSSNVNFDLQLGFKVPLLTWLPYLLIPLGAVLLILGIILLRKRKPP